MPYKPSCDSIPGTRVDRGVIVLHDHELDGRGRGLAYLVQLLYYHNPETHAIR